MSANKALRRLVKRIEELKNMMEVMQQEHEEDMYAAESRAYHAQEIACREKRRMRDELARERSEAEYRQYEKNSILRDVERCHSWGDSYGVEKGLRKLKYL